jgi:prophage regulatory protein
LAKRANVIQGLSMSILRMPAVKAETGHRSHASIYNAIKAGLFPTGVAIGQRSVGWPSDEVQAINAARIAGQTETEIRQLVNRLHAKRLERSPDLAGA